MPERRKISYASPEALIGDVQRLRAGYTRAGNWSLSQACSHLTRAMEFIMRPGPYPDVTPEQKARRPMIESILASGQLPSGIEAPEPLRPAPACTGAEIDAFLDRARAFFNHPGPYAPHRLFGPLTADEMRRLQLIHSAHHLSHLIPNS